MNALRRWMCRNDWVVPIISAILSILLMLNLELFAFMPFWHWWPAIPAILLIPLNVWLSIAILTDWGWRE